MASPLWNRNLPQFPPGSQAPTVWLRTVPHIVQGRAPHQGRGHPPAPLPGGGVQRRGGRGRCCVGGGLCGFEIWREGARSSPPAQSLRGRTQPRPGERQRCLPRNLVPAGDDRWNLPPGAAGAMADEVSPRSRGGWRRIQAHHRGQPRWRLSPRSSAVTHPLARPRSNLECVRWRATVQHRDKRSRVSSSFVLNPMDEAQLRKVGARLSRTQSCTSRGTLRLLPPPAIRLHYPRATGACNPYAVRCSGEELDETQPGPTL